MSTRNVRLYLEQSLSPGQSVELSRAQSGYLFAVMRMREGDSLLVFDGRSGEFRAEIESAGKRGGRLRVLEQSAPLTPPPDLWLLFAPLKKARTDFVIEKATELGVAAILPVQTHYTNAERIRQDRLQAHAIEAAEQCGSTFVPEMRALQPLDAVIRDWPGDRGLIFCDEALAGESLAMPDLGSRGKWAVLVGPEGGFSPAERAALRGLSQSHPISLGPRILRAETAVVASLTLWHAAGGRWRADAGPAQ